MVGVIEGFRCALLKDGSAPDLSIINSVVVATLLFVTGVFYFKRIEKTFADVV
jgi:lipopolysaccharide transport system permease protein